MSPIYKRVQYQKQNGFDVPYWDIDTLPDASPSPTPSITPTISITPSITPTISLTPTNTPSNTNTPTPSVSPSTTPTITPTSSITPTPSTSSDPCPACNEFEIINSDLSSSLSVEYKDCNTYGIDILVVPANSTDYICSCITPIRVFGSTNYTINFNGSCPL